MSLSEDDVAFVDRYAREHGAGSRSAVLQRALLLLKTSELGDDYAAAWDEWAPEAEAWDATIGDGLG